MKKFEAEEVCRKADIEAAMLREEEEEAHWKEERELEEVRRKELRIGNRKIEEGTKRSSPEAGETIRRSSSERGTGCCEGEGEERRKKQKSALLYRSYRSKNYIFAESIVGMGAEA
jgi:hypothetical protein